MKHVINVQSNGANPIDGIIDNAVRATLQNEEVDVLCVVNVLITDDEGIREYNREYRSIDKATDVLSFPMQEFIRAGWSGHGELEFDEDTGELPLGDIIISEESVARQATEYGNTAEYETAYLITHSTLHLLGYDHVDESSEKVMHDKSKALMHSLGLN